MGAEHDAALAAPGDPREQVAGVGAGGRSGVVLLDLESDPAELRGDPVGARALVPGRALDPAQRDERLVQALAFGVARAPHGALARVTLGSDRGCLRCLDRPGWRQVRTAGRVACASAAPTNSRNSGAGRSGRDLNSGWYCEAT